jgi:hypothetical protein
MYIYTKSCTGFAALRVLGAVSCQIRSAGPTNLAQTYIFECFRFAGLTNPAHNAFFSGKADRSAQLTASAGTTNQPGTRARRYHAITRPDPYKFLIIQLTDPLGRGDESTSDVHFSLFSLCRADESSS